MTLNLNYNVLSMNVQVRQVHGFLVVHQLHAYIPYMRLKGLKVKQETQEVPGVGVSPLYICV